MLRSIECLQKRIETLDILKTVGVLIVALTHYNLMFPNLFAPLHKVLMTGQIGVQIFLFVGGFLTAKTMENGEKIGIGKIIGKRFVSLAPGYWIAILLYVLLSVFSSMVTPLSGRTDAPSIIGNVLLLHGILPFCNNNVVPGGWYVSTLMLISVLTAVIMYFGEKKKKTARYYHGVMAFFSAFNVVLTLVLGNAFPDYFGNNSFYYYSVFCQMPAYLMGVYCCRSYDRMLRCSKVKLIVMSLTAFVVLEGSLVCGNKLAASVVPTVASLACMGCFLLLEKCMTTKNNRAVQALGYIGRHSYGCYLVHFVFVYYVVAFAKSYVNISETSLFFILLIPILSLSCLVGVVFDIVLKKLSRFVTQKIFHN